jgi:hypothetical protein
MLNSASGLLKVVYVKSGQGQSVAFLEVKDALLELGGYNQITDLPEDINSACALLRL